MNTDDCVRKLGRRLFKLTEELICEIKAWREQTPRMGWQEICRRLAKRGIKIQATSLRRACQNRARLYLGRRDWVHEQWCASEQGWGGSRMKRNGAPSRTKVLLPTVDQTPLRSPTVSTDKSTSAAALLTHSDAVTTGSRLGSAGMESPVIQVGSGDDQNLASNHSNSAHSTRPLAAPLVLSPAEPLTAFVNPPIISNVPFVPVIPPSPPGTPEGFEEEPMSEQDVEDEQTCAHLPPLPAKLPANTVEAMQKFPQGHTLTPEEVFVRKAEMRRMGRAVRRKMRMDEFLRKRSDEESLRNAEDLERFGRESIQAKIRAADPLADEPTNLRVLRGVGLVGPDHPRYAEGMPIGRGARQNSSGNGP